MQARSEAETAAAALKGVRVAPTTPISQLCFPTPSASRSSLPSSGAPGVSTQLPSQNLPEPSVATPVVADNGKDDGAPFSHGATNISEGAVDATDAAVPALGKSVVSWLRGIVGYKGKSSASAEEIVPEASIEERLECAEGKLCSVERENSQLQRSLQVRFCDSL